MTGGYGIVGIVFVLAGGWLRSRGVARIDGIDLTPEMLARARARGIDDRLELADVAATGLDGGVYDLVTTCLVD